MDELAKIEHLSTFYLSHFIREHIRLSFQEFLSFARVEMSEIPLLETEKKISVIARESGFSTTSYYEKFFSKWFGHTPAEYRSIFTSDWADVCSRGRVEFITVDSEAFLA